MRRTSSVTRPPARGRRRSATRYRPLRRGCRVERTRHRTVIETHVHADFLSGHLELAERTGAGHLVRDGGECRLRHRTAGRRRAGSCSATSCSRVLATPGHTPESISIVVFERDRRHCARTAVDGRHDVHRRRRPSRPPCRRPGTPPRSSRADLYQSLRDEAAACCPTRHASFPAHGAGSSCGKQLSTERQSTIGQQRASNYALQPMSEDAFVAGVTEGQPVRPPYFSFDAQRNREAHALLDEDRPPAPSSLDEVLGRPAPVRRCRHAQRGRLRARPPPRRGERRSRRTVRGVRGRRPGPGPRDRARGGPDHRARGQDRARTDRLRSMSSVSWPTRPGPPPIIPIGSTPSSRLTIGQLAECARQHARPPAPRRPQPRRDRTRDDPGARPSCPLACADDLVGALDRSRPTVVYCEGGYRSSLAASVLRSNGFDDVSDVLGGYGAWRAAGLPVAGAGGHPGDVATSSAARVAARVPPDVKEPSMVDDPVPEVDAIGGRALVDGGALLLDVREPDEWVAGHAPDARVDAPRPGAGPGRRAAHGTGGSSRSAARAGDRPAVTEALNAWGFDAVEPRRRDAGLGRRRTSRSSPTTGAPEP